MAQDIPPTLQAFPRVRPIALTVLLGTLLTFPIPTLSFEIKNATKPLQASRSRKRPPPKAQPHTYELSFAPDEFAKVVVRQLGTDIVMEIQSAEGTTKIDGANGSAGHEQVVVIGSARLKVSAKYGKLEQSAYEMVIEERRPATVVDRKRLAIQRAFLEGERLRRLETRDSWEAAVTSLNDAIQGWRELGDQRLEALALRSRGSVYFYLNMMPESLASYQEALAILRLLPNRLDEASALLSMAITQLDMADSVNATRSFERALELFRGERDEKFVGTTLYHLGRASFLLSDLTQALRFYEQALPIRQRHDLGGEGFTLLGMGRVYAHGFMDYEHALSFYTRALAKRPLGGHPRLMAQVRGDIGKLYFWQHNFARALTEYTKALEEKTDARVTAEILMYVGMVYAARGENQKALEKFQDALSLQCKTIKETGAAVTLRNFKRESCDLIGAAHTLKNMGLSYSAVQNYDKALEHLNQALQIWAHVLYRTAEADTRYEIARVQKRLGNLAEARLQIEASLPIVELLRTKIANQHLRTSYFASVQKFYELYIDVLMRQYAETGDRSMQALALTFSERARTRSMLDTLIEAQAEVRSGARADDLQKESAIQRKLALLSQRQMIDPRQNESQKVRIRQDLASLMDEYRALEARIRESSPRYAALTHPDPLSVESMQRLLDPDQMLLEFALGEERSYLWVVTPDSIKSYELPNREELERASDRMRTLLNKQSPEYFKVASSLSKTLFQGVEFSEKSPRLLIVASGRLQYLPFAALPFPIRGTHPTLESVVSGKRESVPLLVYHEIETLPSVSVLAQIRREPSDPYKAPKRKQVIVIADPVTELEDDRFKELSRSGRGPRRESRSHDPVRSASPDQVKDSTVQPFTGGAPRLIFTGREADAILSALTPGMLGDKVLSFNANQQFVTNQGALADYRIVHFAAHGVINDEYPELSGILLSLFDEQRHWRDGLLQMHEIYNLSIPADIVVLSACDTSIGKEMKGEGLPGLSRAFIYAGARRVVASLWQVRDYSTAELMGAFYRKLFQQPGIRPAGALREAQLEQWKKGPLESPYHWGAFITYGDSKF